MTATIVVAVTDLMFQQRVRDRAQALGFHVIVADSNAAVGDAVAPGAELCVLDLHVTDLEWRAAVEAAKAQGVPVLAFGRHTEAILLREARNVGCDRVVPRSTLVDDFEKLVMELVARREFLSMATEDAYGLYAAVWTLNAMFPGVDAAERLGIAREVLLSLASDGLVELAYETRVPVSTAGDRPEGRAEFHPIPAEDCEAVLNTEASWQPYGAHDRGITFYATSAGEEAYYSAKYTIHP